MAPSLGGHSASPQPEPPRTVISHGEVEEGHWSGSEDDVPSANATNGIPAVVSTSDVVSKTALMESAVSESSEDDDDDDDDEEGGAQALAAAATAAIADVTEDLIEGAIETGLGTDIQEVDVDVDVDVATVPETQASTQSSTVRGKRGKSKSASAAPAPKNAAASKPARMSGGGGVRRAASKPATSENQVVFAGEAGPDTSHEINGETQWEIERIVDSENDGKTLLVKWRGWKGFWEEDRDIIAESVPELVAAFEKRAKNGQARRAGKREAGGNAIPASRGPRAEKKTKASAATTTTTTTKAKRGPLAAKTIGAKIEKKSAAATTKKDPGAKRGRAAPVTNTTAETAVEPAQPHKATTTKSPAKPPNKEKGPFKSPTQSPAKKRGRPKKKNVAGGVGVDVQTKAATTAGSKTKISKSGRNPASSTADPPKKRGRPPKK